MRYDHVLDVDANKLDDPDRDRFLLSKGNGPAAYYAVPAAKDILDPTCSPAGTPRWATTGPDTVRRWDDISHPFRLVPVFDR